MKFYTADLHLDHRNVIKLSKRPFADVKEQQDTIVANWNARVTDRDDVFILGDVCFGKKDYIRFCEMLNGNKHFLIGNHDPKGITNIKIKRTQFNPLIYKVKDGDRKIVLCHYPLLEWPGWFNSNVYHFHGHCHGNRGRNDYDNRAFDVGMDINDFEPKTAEEIISGDITND